MAETLKEKRKRKFGKKLEKTKAVQSVKDKLKQASKVRAQEKAARALIKKKKIQAERMTNNQETVMSTREA